jgi:hypothetical protein
MIAVNLKSFVKLNNSRIEIITGILIITSLKIDISPVDAAKKS